MPRSEYFARIDMGNDWVLAATGNGWQVYQTGVIKSGVNKGRTHKKGLINYGTLQQALAGMEEQWMKRSGARTVEDLRRSHLEFRTALTKFFEIRVAG